MATWRAARGERVVGGVRLDRAWAKDWRAAAGSFDERHGKTLPSGFVRYEQDFAATPASWYAGIGHVERFPDYWELFSASQGPAGAVNAFAGLAPEKTTQIDVGARYKTRELDMP